MDLRTTFHKYKDSRTESTEKLGMENENIRLVNKLKIRNKLVEGVKKERGWLGDRWTLVWWWWWQSQQDGREWVGKGEWEKKV